MDIWNYFSNLIGLPKRSTQCLQGLGLTLLKSYNSDMDDYIKILESLRETRESIDSETRGLYQISIRRLLRDIEEINPHHLSRRDSHNLELKKICLRQQYEWFFGECP